jgi:hypothetical protein
VGKKPKAEHPGAKNLTPWQPGQSGNPKGRAPLPPDLRDAKKWSKELVTAAIDLAMSRNAEELAELAADPSAPRIVVALAKMLEMAIEKGDYQRLDFLLQRAIGKVVDHVEVKQVTPFVIRHTTGEQTVLGAKVESEEEP